jgi:hypothetical protein
MKGNTVFLFLILTFLFVGPAKGQESELGIKGGLNFSNMSVDGSNDENLKTGIMFGVFNKISVNESFSIQPELTYSSKGLKIDYEEEGFLSGESKFKLHYLEVPLKLVFNLSEDFEFQFGPYASYLLDAGFETDGDLAGIDISSEDDIDRDHFKAWEFGLTGGLGFDFDPLVLGFNYNMGLTQVARDDEPSELLLGEAKNNVIQIYVGFKF